MKIKYSQAEFFEEARRIHSNKYSYNESIYIDMKSKIRVLCSVHGYFNQNASDHVNGHGCRKCYIDSQKKWTSHQDNFLKENYKEKGAYWCAEKLNKTDHSIRGRATYLKIGRKQSVAHDHIPANFWNNLIGRVKEDGREMSPELDKDFIWNLYLRQKGKCALTGWCIAFSQTCQENTASLDRIDSNIGYLLNNVQLTHKIANRCKLNLPEELFFQMCKSVYSAHKDKTDQYILEWEDDIYNDTEYPVKKYYKFDGEYELNNSKINKKEFTITP